MVVQHHSQRSEARESVEVELFGVPRLLAGQRSLVVTGRTLGEIVTALATSCPALRGPVIEETSGWLHPGYTFVVDERFTRDATIPVSPRDTVLLVASAAGGRA